MQELGLDPQVTAKPHKIKSHHNCRQFPYLALNLAALLRKICCCHLLRASGSGLRSRGEIDSTRTAGISALGACKIMSNSKASSSVDAPRTPDPYECESPGS